MLQFTKLLLPSKLLQAPPLPLAALQSSPLLLAFLVNRYVNLSSGKQCQNWQTMPLSLLPAPTQCNPPHFCSCSCSCSCTCICQVFALQQLLQTLDLLLFLSIHFASGSSSLPSPSHFLSQSSPLTLTFPWNSLFKSNLSGKHCHWLSSHLYCSVPTFLHVLFAFSLCSASDDQNL